MTNAIAIHGYAVAATSTLPASAPLAPTSLANELPAWYTDVAPLPRKYQRFGGRVAAEAVAAVEKALAMAEIEPQQFDQRFGLYTSQAGFQHSDLDDYHQGFSQATDEAPLYDTLWNSKAVNPFLAIKGLSNNLMGLISVLWEIRGDCSAFLRDQSGAMAALSEACFQLQAGYIDAALVVMSGTACDQLEATISADNALSEENALLAGQGAVALVLGRQTDTDSLPLLSELEVRSGTNAEPTSAPRWGGILYSIAEQLAISNTQQQNTTIHSQDSYGNQAQVRLTTPSL
ncbi:MAG: hypothetical protein CMF25_06555 [Kangiellaceae bacterium]|nr:hypothetical protein [Kangiellaceae bacterium]|tara:strand:+ start:4581 stop:5447 length:867 start_codon:yes stop_codon:yes gene_type:complete